MRDRNQFLAAELAYNPDGQDTVFWITISVLNAVYFLLDAATDPQPFSGRAILAVRNDMAATINSNLLDVFSGEPVELFAVDTAQVEDATTQDIPPPELLQSFESPSLLPSRLLLKVGVPVMLLRNPYPSQGLCNGARLVLARISPRYIEGRILFGEFAGQLRMLSRIKLTFTRGDYRLLLPGSSFLSVCPLLSL